MNRSWGWVAASTTSYLSLLPFDRSPTGSHGKKLVVIAYAAVACPPAEDLMQSSYRELCLEASSDVHAEDIVLVWHDMVLSDNPQLEHLVEASRWRQLFQVPAFA